MDEQFRVLVIDDDPGVRDYLEALVSRQGYQVVAVADGEKALETLEEAGRDLCSRSPKRVRRAITLLASAADPRLA